MPASVTGDASISNSSLDLLERHQAREQARLLQRFRELREWQQQQQQQLMQQQQQQLRTWQDEQSKVQTLIASQGGKTLKPTADMCRSPLMTPPTKPKPSQVTNQVTESVNQSHMAGVSLDSGLVVSMQDTLKSQSSLPKPVMYPSLTSTLNNGDEIDEDKYTNSELFSNLGSHDELRERARELDEETKPVPDWMSDSSENVLRGSQLPPLRPMKGNSTQLEGLEQLLKTAPAGLLQQMLGLLPGGRGLEAQGRGSGHTPEDIELSASPALPPQQEPTARRLLNYHSADADNERSAERNAGCSPVLDSQHQQSRQHRQMPQEQQGLLVQQQQEQAFQQQQRQLKMHSQQWQHYQMQQQYPKNGYKLGPDPSEPDVDPRFVPRVFTLDEGNLEQTAWLSSYSTNNGQGREENQEGYDEEIEDYENYGDDYEEQESNSGEEEEEWPKQSVEQTNSEDRPISGIGGRKTFEQLLEEQLQKEKEEQRLQQENGELGAQRKIPFLKKGEGIARFNSAPKKPPPKKTSKSSQSRSFHSSDLSSASARGENSKRSSEGASRKSSVGSRLKNMGKPSDSRNNIQAEKRGFVRKVQSSQDEKPVAKLSLIRSVASKKIEEQHRHMQRQEQHQQQLNRQQEARDQESCHHQRQQDDEENSSEQPFFRAGPRRLGDLSTIIEQSPSMDGRSTITEDHDSTELDSLAEFEVLEEAADNMSLCSSSSLVGRLLYSDKQGQKEAVQKLKTITESLKSARSEASGSGLEEKEFGTRYTAAAVNSNNNNNYNNNSSNSGITVQYSDGQLISAPNKGLENKTENQDRESLEVTLTDSSDDENEEEKLIVIRHPQDMKEKRRSGSPQSEIDRSDSSTPVSQEAFMPSPSKALTRKVAPLSSKFSAANDTLTLLQSLSAQANVLTSNSKQSSYPTSTAGESSPNFPNSNSFQRMLNSQPQSSLSAGLDFFSGSSTLPPSFFSTASKDALLLSSSTFGPSITQTFQSSSSVFPNVPSSSSDANSITQFQKSQMSNGIPTEKKYTVKKYTAEQSDEETPENSDEETDGQGEMLNKNENDQGRKDGSINREEQKAVTQNKVTDPVPAFDDESAWEDEDDYETFDKATKLKKSASTCSSSQPNVEPATPPTSRLVSKLFPKLKPKPSVETEKMQQSLQQASSQPVTTAMGIQSGILREKLKELDAEIERFRSENSNLEKLRREREEGLAKLKQEIENFQKEKESELKRLEDFKAEEMKKLKRERKLFESYQKKLRSMPDKKEREEIENLKVQLQEVQEELKRKESRWTASTARLKNRVAELELENGEVKEEVRILERKRLEWMTSQAAASGRSGSHTSSTGSSNGKVGGPASIGGGSATHSRGQPGPRSSTPTRESELQGSSSAQPRDLGKKGMSLTTKSAMPSVTSAPINSGINYSNNSNNPINNNIRGRSKQHPTTSNNSNTTKLSNANLKGNNAGVSGAGNSGNKAGTSNGLPHSSSSTVQQQDMPSSTATLVAPSVPVTVLAPPAQHQQHPHQPLRSSREGGEGLQTMQNTAVPVMMECTIPAGTDVSKMPGLQADPSSPDKSAARQAMEKAVVDKGDPLVYTESVHQDGKLEKTFRTGAKEILFPNGTVKEISADGQTIVCRLANGDIRQILPDHRVVYIFSEAQIMQTTFPDGLETFQFQNGQIERRYPDGTVEITFPSKDIKYLFPDGGQEVILTDGTVMQYNSQGERTVEYPSGDREVHTAEFQRREFPDGIIKTIYADGRHETRFPNGRVRMRDKDGNVVMDQIVYR
ncbi:centromere protein J [Elysia marginata]|uniref:Centromere protein J n=1 Tax=Elysia marginata TaxID=1093978 RepID=A0AAV4HFY2_9GAST|nr:centromere protein J [Elysia marginata]